MSANPERTIVIKDQDQRLVYGDVYKPFDLDSDGECMTHEDVVEMAHNFMAHGRVNKVDVGHSLEESGVLVVESFIAKENDPDGFVPGAWVIGVKVIPDEIWDKVKKCELNAFSFYGSVERVPHEAEVTIARKVTGTTEKNTDGFVPEHHHEVDIELDENGRVQHATVGEAQEHTHTVSKVGATDSAIGHSHRMIIEE